MRNIYLVRHGRPSLPAGYCCIGRIDLPLDPVGREQAMALSSFFNSHPVNQVFSSPSARCLETAELAGFGNNIRICEELAEVDVGDWDGLPFSEIMQRWPEEYDARGKKLGSTAPPGGESFADAAVRFDGAVRSCLTLCGDAAGDIAIFAHAGVIRAWLAFLGCCPTMDDLMTLRVPYGSVSTVTVSRNIPDNKLLIYAGRVGAKPLPYPGAAECESLFTEHNTPTEVISHCRAVSNLAAELTEISGAACDRKLLKTACLLHDLCRTEGRSHPAAAAKVLVKAGYPLLAEIISQHHDLTPGAPVEAELLYLADQLTLGTRRVTLEERYAASRKKCTTPEAVALWEARYRTAVNLKNKYQFEE
ncbi:MAG: histidine phosphatase family protein [Oscillospiraceae bacterium]